MIQEERKADEFEPEPKPEEVEDAREVSLMKTNSCGGDIPRKVTKVVLKAVNRIVGEELWMTAAGTGSDRR